ncbi:MAG: glycosyltransferase family A protein [Minwuia sp.]|nr:glycosyltransferase family A protein [Minwuia sp.]
MTNPMVTVITTSYNSEAHIGTAIESVLNQTFEDFEYLVVDDASDDETMQIARNCAGKDRRIRLLRNETNLGDYPNRHRAVAEAQGRYIKFLDSDNVLYPHALDVHVRYMEAYPEAGLGLCKVNDESRPLPYDLAPETVYQKHYLGGGFLTNAPTSAIFRRSAYEAVGGFRSIRHRGDLDLWLRLSARFPVVAIPAFLDRDFRRPGQESEGNLARKRNITYRVSVEALSDPACPLPEADCMRTLRKYRKNFVRGTLLAWRRGEFGLRNATRIFSETGTRLKDALG